MAGSGGLTDEESIRKWARAISPFLPIKNKVRF